MTASAEDFKMDERKFIDKFFDIELLALYPAGDKSCTEDDCMKLAKRLLNTEDIRPVNNQGMHSFTVISDTRGKIVQFRLERLDEEVLKLAHEVYGGEVPSLVEDNGKFPLPVYISSVIPGKIHFLQDLPKEGFPLNRQQRTVADMAEFYTRALKLPQPQSACTGESLTKNAPQIVQQLIGNESLANHAPELIVVLRNLQGSIYRLENLPLVLTHADLAEINILVDEEGHVTGVVDFESATIEAFGMSMWGIWECFLGQMDKGKYSFFNQVTAETDGRTVRDVLEGTFWSALRAGLPSTSDINDMVLSIRTALAVGVIGRYFVSGMVEHIDLERPNHARSLDYARHILPAVCH